MWRSKDETKRFETTHCPVCRCLFGKRDKETIFMAHCEECRAVFYWRPGESKPTVELDTNRKRNHCGCGGCGR